WARYSKFVGDIFGAPLAAEGVLAFFLESGFLGLYLFGRKKVSKGVHLTSIVMVAIGSTLSAFWILVADSWMQTPAGFVVRDGRAELTSFAQAIFNPSTLPRFLHTVTAAIVCGSFFMAGIAACLLRRDSRDELARRALKIALVVGLISSVLVAFPFGHEHARQVARTQPEKFAAIEGLYSSQNAAPLVVFAIPFTRPPELKARFEVPGILSLLAFGDMKAPIRGINEFPTENVPPLWLTFVSFHNMVLLGTYFIALMMLANWKWKNGSLWTSRKFLLILVCSIPLPLAACQLGWMAAEVGRQPWIVYGLTRTADAFSATVGAGEVLFSIVMFGLLYLMLGALYVFLLVKKIQHGPPNETGGDIPASSDRQTLSIA
ncbi:MAG TPA: cytochrome ubiquinol oxidase subunit I, partial [Tepidisphaeraceae bacterium]|nr:cytochrome ubiquinol oxidase subunit I [Tepidisphaeraceae bacterium]